MATYPFLRDIDIVNNKFMYDIDTIEWNYTKRIFKSESIIEKPTINTLYMCEIYSIWWTKWGLCRLL